MAVGQAGILPVYPEARRSEFVWPRARSLCYGYFCAQDVFNRPKASHNSEEQVFT